MRLQELLSPILESFTLLEYNRDVTIKNYGSKVLPIARRDRSIPEQFRDKEQVTDEQLLDLVLDQIEKSDPTKNKEYSQALTKIYAQGQTPFEDMGSTLADYLTKFHKLKLKKVIPSPRNDFMRYTSVGDFMSVVDEYPDVGEEQDDKGKVTEIYKDQDLRVIQPLDQTGACYYGRGTRWCTAANTNNMFDTYNKKGPMYIIIPSKPMYNGEKYQWHFETKQFMNEKDERSPVVNLVKRYPQLKEIFYDQAHNYDIKGLLLDPKEYEERLRKFPEAIKNTLMERIQYDVGIVAKAILTQLRREVKELNEDMVDSQEFIEMVWEAFNDNGINLVRSIISAVGGDLDTWADEDSMHDILSDQISNWSHEQEFRIMIMDILEDLDEEQAQMDASFTIDGEILDWLLGTIENTVEEYL